MADVIVISLTQEEFFNREPDAERAKPLDLLLIDSFTNKYGISFDFMYDGGVGIFVDRNPGKELLINASYPNKIALKAGVALSVLDSNIFLPYLLRIKKVVFPHNLLFSCGWKDVSIAELFIRNLISNILLRTSAKLKFSFDSNVPNEMSSQLVCVYYWFLKDAFKKEFSSNAVQNEHLKANCIYPFLTFNNARLKDDAEAIAKLDLEYSNEDLSEIVAKLLACREKTINTCFS